MLKSDFSVLKSAWIFLLRSGAGYVPALLSLLLPFLYHHLTGVGSTNGAILC